MSDDTPAPRVPYLGVVSVSAGRAPARLRVLIADDDPDFRAALAEIIRQEPSFELVGAAGDADETVRLARERAADVALVDVKMPRGGGPAAARGLRSAAPACVALALSGYDDAATVTEMLEAGAAGYLVKGASVNEIVDGVSRCAFVPPGSPGAAAAAPPAAAREAAEPVTVLAADDNPEYLEALAHLLAGDPALSLVGKASDVRQAVRLAALYLPDIALLDVQMDGGSGAAREILEVSPSTRCVALSFQTDRAKVIDMLRAGAKGYIVKTVSAPELLTTLHRSAAGLDSLSPEITGPILEALTIELPGDAATEERDRADRASLERVLEGDGVSICFQPIFEVRTRRAVGMEALARFDGDPSRTPDVWFNEASRLGLAIELEMLAGRLATAQLPALPAGVDLFLNFSPETIVSGELARLFDDVPAERVVVEVTEHAPIGDYALLTRQIDALRRRGARVAVDDIGAGYASLQHILELNPDVLKLHVGLCRSIDSDGARQFLARGLASFAQSIWAKVVAEGIETAEELETVEQLGITCAQGYYLGRPAPLVPDNECDIAFPRRLV